MDKLVAVGAGMAASLYLLASGIAWYRVLSPTYHHRAFRHVLDRAIAWTALFVIFSRAVVVRLELFEWGDDRLDVILIISLLAIWASGIVSVRSFTIARFGPSVWLNVAVFSLITGLIIFMV